MIMNKLLSKNCLNIHSLKIKVWLWKKCLFGEKQHLFKKSRQNCGKVIGNIKAVTFCVTHFPWFPRIIRYISGWFPQFLFPKVFTNIMWSSWFILIDKVIAFARKASFLHDFSEISRNSEQKNFLQAFKQLWYDSVICC